jgi:23S rRNA (cytosine1962-C5)-methyltransferase
MLDCIHHFISIYLIMLTTSVLYLKKKAERRLHGGHLWVYSNEVDTAKSPMSSFQPGQEVIVKDYSDKSLGRAYINPHSLIVARLLSYDIEQEFNSEFIYQRLATALALRQSLYSKPYYRLVYGEADLLPGLVIDRFNDTLVMQLNTAGMEQKLEQIQAALIKLLQPKAILLRNDSSMRQLEGLPSYTKAAYGEPEDEVLIEENGVKFHALIKQGQKTGWFYDHRENRLKLKQFVKNKRVLDVFSYLGAWGIQAAVFGASSVTCIDSSEKAIAQISANAVLNNVSEQVSSHCADAFTALNDLLKQGELFDVIILDPPAFIKRKKDLAAGQLAYRRINELALRLLRSNGILFTASCSMHLAATELNEILRRCARKLDRPLQIIAQGHQGPDHPIHPAIAETQYLKLLVARIV